MRRILQHFPEQDRIHPAIQKYLRAVTADLDNVQRGPRPAHQSQPQQQVLGPQGAQAAHGDSATMAMPTGAGNFALQIASIKKERRTAAEQEVAKLKRQGFNAFLDVRERHVVICIGPYQSKDQAVLSEFKRRYPGTFWITIRR